MNIVDIITKKLNNKTLSPKEIEYFVKTSVSGQTADYQVSALLAAIFVNGMNDEETFFLTKYMMESGDILDFSSVSGIKADKHSTGGVADTVTLIAAPAVASCGVRIIKMSGRGLGYSGGTIDKLSAIPGFTTDISKDEALKMSEKSGIVIMGQTDTLAPADKKFYALRDVTGTVESAPLIVSSILSKKLASGADTIVFDVKCGNGAFMKDINSAKSLALQLTGISSMFGKKTAAVISDMSQPLGMNIGNSLEVIEAIEVLKGNVEGDLYELSCLIGGCMVFQAQKTKSLEDGVELIKKSIKTGQALSKFEEFVAQQGGNAKIINNYGLLPKAGSKIDIKADKNGYINSINTQLIGRASVETGAGRIKKNDSIDLGAGIIMNARIGDFVKEDDILLTILSSTSEKCLSAAEIAKNAFEILPCPIEKPILIKDIITKE